VASTHGPTGERLPASVRGTDLQVARGALVCILDTRSKVNVSIRYLQSICKSRKHTDVTRCLSEQMIA
jgi:hypothetical protein